jgi:hypothetical protein
VTFDQLSFSYGVGLVLCGWIAGMLVGAAIRLVKSVR